MSRISIILLLFAVLWNNLGFCYTTADVEISTPVNDVISGSEEQESSVFSKEKINKAIENIEEISSTAENSNRKGILPVEDIEKMYNAMNANFEDIIEMLANPNNAYEFLQAKGLDRIMITNIETPYTPLRNTILNLLKILFDVAPSTADAVMPARMIDKVLDIFVTDDDLTVKENVVDILDIWLPENPRVQARVMKIKGLVPFYEQISKLEVRGVRTLLNLFNKILKEHLDVRYKKPQKSKRDGEELKLYQRIGLIEHMSRKEVCNGLLEIFRFTWHSEPENELSVLILDLSTKVAPFCLNAFKGKLEAEELFDNFLKYLKEQDRQEYLAKFGMNASDIETIVTNYLDSLKQVSEMKDEF
ncbi:uncharacterized protein LOC128680379 [Plodia interpunctella]|uniref:uncharacterized protein LOC128680379 n=1 Tax=Plodia interpunctella TaxID=58824 RepID=UPI00236865AD|nr:uncharacterized protein LOC128680379 [Plodia interpunctella]